MAFDARYTPLYGGGPFRPATSKMDEGLKRLLSVKAKSHRPRGKRHRSSRTKKKGLFGRGKKSMTGMGRKHRKRGRRSSRRR